MLIKPRRLSKINGVKRNNKKYEMKGDEKATCKACLVQY
jgi:hypothetical protein